MSFQESDAITDFSANEEETIANYGTYDGNAWSEEEENPLFPESDTEEEDYEDEDDAYDSFSSYSRTFDYSPFSDEEYDEMIAQEEEDEWYEEQERRQREEEEDFFIGAMILMDEDGDF